MPEAFAILAVFIIVVAAWLGAWLNARNPANQNAAEEIARLHVQVDWLERRLQTARRERWGGEMIANLSIELGATIQQLAQARAKLPRGAAVV